MFKREAKIRGVRTDWLRPLIAMAGIALLSGCSTTGTSTSSPATSLRQPVEPPRAIEQAEVQLNYAVAYGPMQDGEIAVPAFDHTRQKERFLRREVAYSGSQPAGTIVVDTKEKFLYLVLPNRRAIRYGISVGSEGHEWSGTAVIKRKAQWPTWTPPASMIERKPELAKYAEGMDGGTHNPLGARALYLFKDGRDTLYRIHGTTQPYSIGKAASSGCFRMVNQDVIDLYDRVGNGTRVFVKHGLKVREDI